MPSLKTSVSAVPLKETLRISALSCVNQWCHRLRPLVSEPNIVEVEMRSCVQQRKLTLHSDFDSCILQISKRHWCDAWSSCKSEQDSPDTNIVSITRFTGCRYMYRHEGLKSCCWLHMCIYASDVALQASIAEVCASFRSTRRLQNACS